MQSKLLPLRRVLDLCVTGILFSKTLLVGKTENIHVVVESSGELEVLLAGYLCDFLKDVCNWCLRFFYEMETSSYD